MVDCCVVSTIQWGDLARSSSVLVSSQHRKAMLLLHIDWTIERWRPHAAKAARSFTVQEWEKFTNKANLEGVAVWWLQGSKFAEKNFVIALIWNLSQVMFCLHLTVNNHSFLQLCVVYTPRARIGLLWQWLSSPNTTSTPQCSGADIPPCKSPKPLTNLCISIVLCSTKHHHFGQKLLTSPCCL